MTTLQTARNVAAACALLCLLAMAATASEEPVGAEAGRARVAVGDAVPDLSLVDLEGERHTLSEALPHGPRILVFFRGVW